MYIHHIFPTEYNPSNCENTKQNNNKFDITVWITFILQQRLQYTFMTYEYLEDVAVKQVHWKQFSKQDISNVNFLKEKCIAQLNGSYLKQCKQWM